MTNLLLVPMKTVCFPVSFASLMDDRVFEAVRWMPGVLAVLVDRRSTAVQVVAVDAATAERARHAVQAVATA